MANHYINRTDAKDVALHFYEKKKWRVDANIGRSINTVKALLKNGYTKDEIISVIDYLFEHSKVEIYSIGYVNFAINETLDKIKKEQTDKKAKQEKAKLPAPKQLEVDNGSTNRNKEKLQRGDSKSNVGKKYNFDLFKEQ